jgi:hypothetical protein
VHVIYLAIGFPDTVMDKTHFFNPNAKVFLRNIQNNRNIIIKNMPVRRLVSPGKSFTASSVSSV